MAPGPILVTGAAGFLGSRVLERAGAEAVGTGRSAGPGRWVVADLREDLARLLGDVAPRAVVHCAALSRVGACEDDPERARVENVDVPAELARRCAAAGVRLVHVSTDLVFGAVDAPAGGFDEDARTAPVSVYGATKRDGEDAVLAAHDRAVVARMPLLYGDSGGRGRGATDAVLAAVERGETPPLFVDEWRTPLAVGAAAAALLELADRPEVAGTLHVAGPERVDRHALGVAALESAGFAGAASRVRAVRRADVATRGARPADVSLDATRARALLAAPLPGVAEGLAAEGERRG